MSRTPLSAAHRARDFVVLLAAYLVARWSLLGTFESPSLGWRPAELASIALNYYRNGFHFLYPQVQWGGSGPGYVEMEFPLQPFATGALFRLFGVHESLCLVIPLLAGFALVWVIYLFGCHLFGEAAGIVAGAVTAVVPTLTMLTTWGLWPDPPMVLCGALGLYLLTLWSEGRDFRYLVLGSANISLAILLKLTALYAGPAVLCLFVRRYGRSTWKSSVLWCSAIGVLAPPVLWYWHARNLYLEYGNTFGIFGAGYSKFATPAVLLDWRLLRLTLFRIFFYHLTPLGAVAATYGLLEAARRRCAVLLVWVASVVVYCAIVWRGVRDGHYQYLLPVLPIGALLAGLGAQAVFERLSMTGRSERSRTMLQALFVGAFVLLFGASAMASADWFVIRDRGHDTQVWRQKQATGLRVRRTTRPGSLILVVDTSMDEETPSTSMSPPEVFYFGDRRGWYLAISWLSIDKVEGLRAKGAEYFVVSAQSAPDFKIAQSELMAYLSRKYAKLVDDADGIIFSLVRP